MAWFILARLLFTGAVVYSAFLLQPLGPQPTANLLFGAGLALLAVVFEWHLRETPVTCMAGALLGGAIGLALAKGIGAAHEQFGPDTRLIEVSSATLLYLATPGDENLFVFFDLIMGARGLGGSARFRLDDIDSAMSSRSWTRPSPSWTGCASR